MEWLNEKLWQLDDFRKEYPKVFWLGYFYLILSAISVAAYPYLLNKISNISLINQQPFYNLINNNMEFLKWGIFVVPIAIILFGLTDVIELYEKKKQRYRYY